jgi:hypothetical protein
MCSQINFLGLLKNVKKKGWSQCDMPGHSGFELTWKVMWVLTS